MLLAKRVAKDDVQPGRPVDCRDERRQVLLEKLVVVVEKHHEAPAARVEACVARRGSASVWLTQENDVCGLNEGLELACRAVGRAIVHHHDLDRTVALSLHASDRSLDQVSAVACGNDHRDDGPGFSTLGLSVR